MRARTVVRCSGTCCVRSFDDRSLDLHAAHWRWEYTVVRGSLARRLEKERKARDSYSELIELVCSTILFVVLLLRVERTPETDLALTTASNFYQSFPSTAALPLRAPPFSTWTVDQNKALPQHYIPDHPHALPCSRRLLYATSRGCPKWRGRSCST